MLEHVRWDRVFSVTCIRVPWQLRPDQRNLVRPVAPEAEADQGVALVRDACRSENRSEEIRHEERAREVRIHRRMPSTRAVWRQVCTMRRFLMTTDAEIAMVSSWQRTMTSDKLSE